MKKSKLKAEIAALLSERINGRPYDSLESYALFVLQQKWANNALNAEEKRLLVGDFLSDFLTFDPQTGEPVGNTPMIEEMMDFMLHSDGI